MPKIERWNNLPPNVRQHLIDRMRDRTISIADLNQLRLCIAVGASLCLLPLCHPLYNGGGGPRNATQSRDPLFL